MIAVITKIRAHSVEQFGELSHREEYVYLLKGKIVVATEFYNPVTLGEGQSIYIGSSIGHAYLTAEGCDETEVLGVRSSSDDELMKSLLNIPDEQKRGDQPRSPA